MKRGNVDAIYRPDSMTFQDKHIRPHLLIPNIGFNNIMIASSRKVDGCSNLPGLGAELHEIPLFRNYLGSVSVQFALTRSRIFESECIGDATVPPPWSSFVLIYAMVSHMTLPRVLF